jgi:hypothetical protein
VIEIEDPPSWASSGARPSGVRVNVASPISAVAAVRRVGGAPDIFVIVTPVERPSKRRQRAAQSTETYWLLGLAMIRPASTRCCHRFAPAWSPPSGRSTLLGALAILPGWPKGAAQAVGATRIGIAAGALGQASKAGDRAGFRDGFGPLAAELRGALGRNR